MEELNTISPIDGRYVNKTEKLREYFSESALINSRIIIECEYFIFLHDFLSKKGKIKNKLKDHERKLIREIYREKEKNAKIVKKIETEGYKNIKPTNHDVKAVEYYLKYRLKDKIKTNIELIHFGLTSEDINNIAYSFNIERFIKEAYTKEIEKILEILEEFIRKHHSSAFPSRTHGQLASPTTFGKEMRIFYERIKNKLTRIKKQKLKVKLNGAVGNYNSFVCAHPEIDWISFSIEFIKFINKRLSTNFEINLYTTQIEPHDSWVELFNEVKHLNSILIGLSQDIWRYISDDLIIMKKLDWEVGSSTMPHKVNPIDFENAEGNLQVSNSLFELLVQKLPISRLQRDLTDSTVIRNIGVAFSHSYIAVISILNGFSKIQLNQERSTQMLKNHYELYAEAIQTILRKHQIRNAYEILKEFSRGRNLTKDEVYNFIEKLNISEKIKKEIYEIFEKPYIGIAPKLSLYKLTKNWRDDG